MSILSAEGIAFDVKVPVVIIGAGAAGFVLTLLARVSAQDVLVL